MGHLDWGYHPPMEETPICDSVERDLEIDIDKLTAGITGAVPAPRTPTDLTKRPPATSNV